MFFTPAQRASFGQRAQTEHSGDAGGDNEQPAAPLPQNVSVNGLIQRSDGKNTIWLNNRVVTGQPPGGINAAASKSDNRVRLSLPESGRSIDLKVGQTVEILSGTIEETYSRRAAKPDAKGAPGQENAAAEVAKVAPAQPRDAVKSDSVIQKRSPRTAERDAADDASRDGNPGSK